MSKNIGKGGKVFVSARYVCTIIIGENKTRTNNVRVLKVNQMHKGTNTMEPNNQQQQKNYEEEERRTGKEYP